MNIFMIPGNPPALYFYELWKTEILAKYSSANVRLSPYPCFELGLGSEEYLQQTVAHHEEAFKRFYDEVKAPITVIGHSIGGFIALKLLDAQEARIHKIALLFPFLAVPGPSGKTVLALAHFLQRAAWSKPLLTSLKPALEKFQPDLQQVTEAEMQASLHLAYHEYHIPGQQLTPQSISPTHRGRTHLVYCDHDTWCPASTIAALKQQITASHTTCTHGFITSAIERSQILHELEPFLMAEPNETV